MKPFLLKVDSKPSFSFSEPLFFNYFSTLKTCTIAYSFLYEIAENVLLSFLLNVSPSIQKKCVCKLKISLQSFRFSKDQNQENS